MDPLIITIVLFWLALFHVLPAVLVAGSGRVRGKDLQLWLVAVLFMSWLGFVAFMVVTTLERAQRSAADPAPATRPRAIPSIDISDRRVG